MKKKGSGGAGCGCLGAPMRALSRACDSACDLYVRGMSGCARGVPSGTSAGIVGRGFSGSSATTLRLRVSSDKADDLVRAAAASSRRQQRRVAAEPEPELATPEAVGGYGAGNNKIIIASAGAMVGSAAPAVRATARKRAAAATMGTIAEDAPCEFGPDGAACAAPVPSTMKPPRRGGFGAAKAGRDDDVFAR